MALVVADPDLEDPNPDVWELFSHYDGLYFRGALADAGFSVQWSSQSSSPPPRMVGHFGSCNFGRPSNTITLSEPVLKYRSSADTKNALLHQMIHAILFVKHHTKNRDHGPMFRAWMTAINSCSADDHQRPPDGYNITTRHDFSPDNSTRSINGFLWKCEYCGDTLVRASNIGAPSDACCIENVDNYSTCGNMLCQWHNHKMDCGGTYKKTGKATPAEVQNNGQGTKRCPTDMQMSKSQRAKQEPKSPDSDGFLENAAVMKPKGKGKVLALVGGDNVKLIGSNSSKKGVKRQRPEETQDADAMLAAPLKNLKLGLDLVPYRKPRSPSVVDCNNAKSSGGSASRKESKRHMPENIQKSSVLPTFYQRKIKSREYLVVPVKNEPLSLVNCSNGKSAGSNLSKKLSKQHEPEEVQKSCVQPASPTRKLKQDFVASVKTEIPSRASRSNAKVLGNSFISAGKQHEPAKQDFSASMKNEISSRATRSNAKASGNSFLSAGKHHEPAKQDFVASVKTEIPSRASRSNAKVLGDSFLSAGKQHEPADIQKRRQNEISSTKAGTQLKIKDTQKTIYLPASPQTKLKQSVLQRQTRRSKTRESANEKFAVISAWLNYYESEGSSGSTEPLVNKRTERRRKTKNRITYTRSRKRNVGGSTSLKSQPSEDVSSRAKVAAPCLDIVASTPQQVLNQSAGYQSQSPAPPLAIVPFDTANEMVPLQTVDPTITSVGVIDISDDD